MKIKINSTVAIDTDEIINLYGLNSKSTETEVSNAIMFYVCECNDKCFYALMDNFSRQPIIVESIKRILRGR